MGTRNGRKLLLTSVCKPFGPEYGDGFGVSYEGSHQILWAQGLFRPRATTTQWGIDFIAENLEIPATTLHYPTMAQFKKELRRGYDYLGIAFVSPTLHKMIPMVEAARGIAPSTKIILGGYGTSLGEQITPYADYVCRGEGVKFMRGLLGEDVDAPIVQPAITQKSRLFSMPLGRVGYVFAGLGCPNGCDFCATSHYFKREHIKFLPDGPSILDAIEKLRALYPGLDDFWINDEDFLLNEARGRGFLEAVRKSGLPPISISIFSSVKALSRFKASELVEMGVDWIWVGFEGRRAGYAKMEGRPYGELFEDLRNHGINVMTSMIIGFDYQTPEIIRAEFEELMGLRPTMCQFLIYGPAHGTPAYERMNSEGRLMADLYSDNTKHDGFSLGFLHPHIGPEEMSSIQRTLYKEEFERLGPSVFRAVDDWLTGIVNLRNHPVERVRAKAERYAEDAHRAMMVIPASMKYLNPESAARLEKLNARLAEHTGPLTAKERLWSMAAPAMLWYTSWKMAHGIGQQPEFTRKTFRANGD